MPFFASLIVIAILAVSAGSASAQTVGGSLSDSNAYAIPGRTQAIDPRADDGRDPLKNPIFHALSRGMQDQLLAEAQDYHGQCTTRIVYAAMHNCDCLSIHYLNERLKKPDASQSTLTNIIVDDCIDQPSIAGYAYGRCIDIYSSSYPDIIKPLCECYARRYASEFAKNPNDNSDAEIHLGVRVVGECRAYLQSFAPDLSTPVPRPCKCLQMEHIR